VASLRILRPWIRGNVFLFNFPLIDRQNTHVNVDSEIQQKVITSFPPLESPFLSPTARVESLLLSEIDTPQQFATAVDELIDLDFADTAVVLLPNTMHDNQTRETRQLSRISASRRFLIDRR